MREVAFVDYLASSISSYAEQGIASGRWTAESALVNAKAEYANLLPQGLHTANNRLFEIRETNGHETVGYLWFAIQEKYGSKVAYVFDLRIDEQHRRKGHARRAFLALEEMASDLNLSSISLHVFWQNVGAQALYRRLGYSETGINMRKNIAKTLHKP
jgi:ribosomal protein S18 acetylase RimI-like enzyme